MVKKVKTASAVRLSLNRWSGDVAQRPWSAMGAPVSHSLHCSLVSGLVSLLFPWYQADPPSCSQQLRAVLPFCTCLQALFSAASFQRCLLLWRLFCALCSYPIAPLHPVSSAISCAHLVALSSGSFRNFRIPCTQPGACGAGSGQHVLN